MAVVAGFRTGRVDDRARLNDLFRDHAPELLGLERLTQAGIAACLGAGPGLAVAPPGLPVSPEEIYRLTGGLPLLLKELLRGPGPYGDWTGTAPPGTPTLGVADVVSERTKRIDEEQRKVLDVAAVGGRVVRAGTIAAVTGQDPVEVGALLEEVRARAGLIAPGAGPGSYVWDHALLRQAVLDGVADGRLNQLHHDLSRVLVEEGSAIPAARHALVALRVLQRTATVTVLAGVDEAIDSLAFEVGEELCRSALLAAGDGIELEHAVALLCREGRCLALTGQHEAAEAAWRDAAARALAGDRPDLLAVAALATEPLARASEDLPLRWDLLETAVKLPGIGASLRTEVVCSWLVEAAMPQHATTDPALVAQVVPMARSTGDGGLIMRALWAEHVVERASGRARPDLSGEMCLLADESGDPTWRATARHLALLDAMSAMDPAGAVAHLATFREAALASPSPRLRWLALLVASTWAMLRGDLVTSEARAAEAARLGLAYGVRDATLAAAVHGFFQAFHSGTLAPLADLLSGHAADHPELPAWQAGAGLALASANERGRAAQLRDSMFPAVIRPGVDETWLVTACLTAQLCFDTAAPVGLCQALLAALEPRAGRMAVLAGGVGECGPVSRYIGLLTARVDPTAGATALKAAAEEARLFGATIWSERAEADLACISGGARNG